jgi:hypothetical protein
MASAREVACFAARERWSAGRSPRAGVPLPRAPRWATARLQYTLQFPSLRAPPAAVLDSCAGPEIRKGSQLTLSTPCLLKIYSSPGAQITKGVIATPQGSQNMP